MTSLGYAILGLLAREPLTGYDIAQKLKLPIGFFWTASHSQIYPELEELERERLVTHKLVRQKRRPDKKIFSLSAAGRQALAEWVIQAVEPPRVRDELLLKTYSSWVVDPDRAATFFRGEETRFRDQVARLEAVEVRLRDLFGVELDTPGSEGFASYATLRAGLAVHGAWAEWAAGLASSLEAKATKRRR